MFGPTRFTKRADSDILIYILIYLQPYHDLQLGEKEVETFIALIVICGCPIH